MPAATSIVALPSTASDFVTAAPIVLHASARVVQELRSLPPVLTKNVLAEAAAAPAPASVVARARAQASRRSCVIEILSLDCEASEDGGAVAGGVVGEGLQAVAAFREPLALEPAAEVQVVRAGAVGVGEAAE